MMMVFQLKEQLLNTTNKKDGLIPSFKLLYSPGVSAGSSGCDSSSLAGIS